MKRPASIKEVLACQFSSWYPQFHRHPDPKSKRKTCTIRSIQLQLTKEFIDYLLEDGVTLPSPTEGGGEQALGGAVGAGGRFEELVRDIEKAIEDLGGFVFPKLNWSAPKDASWINGGTLKCESAEQILLLLKSSDFIVHDLLLHALPDDHHHLQQHPTTTISSFVFQLTLRKWSNLHPSMEFRCFVAHHEIIGISQRNHTQTYPHLLLLIDDDDDDNQLLLEIITKFYDHVIRNKFADASISHYVFDCYIDKKETVWIIDFNVWGEKTDALLFTWKELQQWSLDYEEEDDKDDNDDIGCSSNGIIMHRRRRRRPHFRISTEEKAVNPDPLSLYKAPIDAIDMAVQNETGLLNFEEFIAMCKKPSEWSDDDDDDDDDRQEGIK